MLKLQYFGHLSEEPTHWKKPWCWKDWGQEKGVTEDEMFGWHHWLNGYEFEQLRETVKDREAWCAAVHVEAKSWIQLSNWTTTDRNTNFSPQHLCWDNLRSTLSTKVLFRHSNPGEEWEHQICFLLPWSKRPQTQWRETRPHYELTSLWVCLLRQILFRVPQWSESRSVVSDSLRPHGLYGPWNSPGQNTRVDSLSLLQWIFPIQESNWGLLYCRWILCQLSYQGSL